MPAIQLVNYLLTPLQLILIIPLLRFGELLVNAPRFPITLESGLALLSHGAINAVQILATAIAHATLGWIVLAPLLAFVLYRVLEPALRHLARTPTVAPHDLARHAPARARPRSRLPDPPAYPLAAGRAPARRRPARPRDASSSGSSISSGNSHQSPVAIETAAANEQHYEVPTEFYQRVLGPHLKYSSGYLSASERRARREPGSRRGAHAGAHLPARPARRRRDASSSSAAAGAP